MSVTDKIFNTLIADSLCRVELAAAWNQVGNGEK
jgi:hypothetical protein